MLSVETYLEPLTAVRRVLEGADEALLAVAFVQQRVRVQGVGGVSRLGYGRCQGPAASGEGAGWPACQVLAAWIR